jgi:hypothetical protein
VIWLIGQRTDLSRGDIQQVVEARSRIRQAKPETRSLVNDNHTRQRSLSNQVKRREGPTYPSTDDCDCLGWFCGHDSTLGRALHQGKSQSLMPYKQDTAIESVLSLLMRHKFYYLDRTASADQH